LSFDDDRESRRKRKPDRDEAPPAPPRAAKKRPPVSEVGDALRSAYQRTLAEDIPPEMLDLLGKLG